MSNEKTITQNDIKRLVTAWQAEKDRMLALFFAVQEQIEKNTSAWHLCDIGYEFAGDIKEINAIVRGMGIDPMEFLEEVDK